MIVVFSGKFTLTISMRALINELKIQEKKPGMFNRQVKSLFMIYHYGIKETLR